jgi:Zinc carboxypeptidase
MDLDQVFQANKIGSIKNRYITLKEIKPLLNSWNNNSNIIEIGKSVLNQTIYSYKIGSGSKKILLWSQMHGNESTTTKSLLDFIQFLNSKSSQSQDFLNKFTFLCIPMLNPDGAEAYTRENANGIDLNRDFMHLSQPESQALMKIFGDFRPHYCYNLHDQRTIYGAGDTGKPATLSFLAPSFNQNRDFNANRTEACRLINAINIVLQTHIPGQVGRFEDTFNNNCCGDTFQSLGVPTILFEVGHYPNDYARETVRKFLFFALLTSFSSIYENDLVENIIPAYLSIPQNKVNFYDILIKNVKINCNNTQKYTNIAIHYTEKLIANKIEFIPVIVGVGDLDGFNGHIVFDAENHLYTDNQNNDPTNNNSNQFTIVNKVKIENNQIIYLNL